MIFRNSMLLAAFSILAVLFSILRDRLLSVYVGVGPVLDVYNASFRMPDLIYGLFLSFITAGTVVPFLTKESKNGNLLDSKKRFSSIFFFFSLMMSILIVIVIITLPYFAKFLVPGFTSGQLSLFITTTRIIMVQPLILGISSLISCFAQLKNEFVYYGLAPLGYSLGITLSIVFLYKPLGLYGLSVGVVIGAILSLIIQSISITKDKMSISRSDFNFKYVKELYHLALPRSGTNIVSQLRVLFLTAFATTLGPGVLSSYLFAQKITDAIMVITSQSIGTASLPTLSNEYENNNMREHERLVYKYTKLLFASAVVIGIVAFFLRDFIVSLLYGNSGANELIAIFLVGFLILLPFSMTSSYFVIGFYSMKNTSKVLIGNTVATIAMVGICYYFKSSGVYSLIYGIVSYYVISFLIYLYFYNKKRKTLRNI